jgi:LytS/YehU family sensor histidine kinase
MTAAASRDVAGVGDLVQATWERHVTTYAESEAAHLQRLGWWVAQASNWLRYTLMGLLIAGAWLHFRAETELSSTLRQCAADTARLDQQTAEARLQMLEAQIEPHFLFNTLAHVRRLYATDPAAGERMLDSLIDYLSIALPQIRKSEPTLGQEVNHAVAYLNLQQVRMGRRLTFDVDVPVELRSARMPSLMIATLTENAVKHGVGPLPQGGRIDVRACVQDERLRVDVSDTGQGFTRSSGAGTGLANIRARLTALFGDEGRLALAANPPHGVTATIVLPYREASPAGVAA